VVCDSLVTTSPVAYTNADLTAVRTALLRGEKAVQFSDRSVTYRSVDEILKVEAAIIAELAAASTETRPRQFFGVASNGF